MVGILNSSDSPSKIHIRITYEDDSGEIIYSERFAASDIRAEIESQKDEVMKVWGDKVLCAVCCENKKSSAACLVRCLKDGQCCDYGFKNCDTIPD